MSDERKKYLTDLLRPLWDASDREDWAGMYAETEKILADAYARGWRECRERADIEIGKMVVVVSSPSWDAALRAVADRIRALEPATPPPAGPTPNDGG